jgi:FixJ family two-component response regulator
MKNEATVSAMTVFIVDDDTSICESMMNLLEAEGIAATSFVSIEEFLKVWKPSMPGCLLLDVRLPGMTGIELQEKLRHDGVPIPIIFMTAHGDIPMVRRVMKAGAMEFLTKPFQREDLLTAVHQAFGQDDEYRRRSAKQAATRFCYDTLTAREREVMALVSSGLQNRDIAGKLNLSLITVKVHRRRVMEKMRAGSLADLIRTAEVLNPPDYTKG